MRGALLDDGRELSAVRASAGKPGRQHRRDRAGGGRVPMLVNRGTVGGGSPGDLMGAALCGLGAMLLGALLRAVAGIWYGVERIARR